MKGCCVKPHFLLLFIKDGSTALTKAARYNWTHVMKVLFTHPKIHVNMRSEVKKNESPLCTLNDFATSVFLFPPHSLFSFSK